MRAALLILYSAVARTCICLDWAANRSADLLPVPVTQPRVPQRCNQQHMLLEVLQLLPYCLSHLQRSPCQLLQQLGTAAPPPNKKPITQQQAASSGGAQLFDHIRSAGCAKQLHCLLLHSSSVRHSTAVYYQHSGVTATVQHEHIPSYSKIALTCPRQLILPQHLSL